MTKSEAGRQKNQNFHSEELQGLKNRESMKTWVRIPQFPIFLFDVEINQKCDVKMSKC